MVGVAKGALGVPMGRAVTARLRTEDEDIGGGGGAALNATAPGATVGVERLAMLMGRGGSAVEEGRHARPRRRKKTSGRRPLQRAFTFQRMSVMAKQLSTARGCKDNLFKWNG